MSDDLDPAATSSLVALNAADAFAEVCAELDQAPGEGRQSLASIMNTLMTELWDRSFSQTEIREAFNGAVGDMNRYAAGQERRGDRPFTFR